jgi:AAA15 family ATPase/GTPase
VLLRIKGIGKISDSQIKMDGITVIAGENNTGKSTFGKALYCIFNAFCNVEKKIYDERVNGIQRIIERKLFFDEFQVIRFNKKVMDRVIALNQSFSAASLLEIVKDSFSPIPEDDIKELNDIINTSIDEIGRFVTISNGDIQQTIITRYFRNEFEGQANHLNRVDLPGEVSLTIKGKNISVTIRANECSTFEDHVGIQHDAIYIDSPFVVDNVQQQYRRGISRRVPSNVHHRQNLVYRLAGVTDNTIIEEAVIKQKINTIVADINKIVAGEFRETKDDLVFIEHGMQKPIELSNLSAGLKVFIIIKRLLETGEIKNKGVLIFDEPEIHLHPDWQLKFAEVLILLQKEFNLTILVTTHSPYFLEALEVYGKKYGIDNRCNYYLAEIKSDAADVREVNGNTNDIYRQLAGPFRKLENIAFGD